MPKIKIYNEHLNRFKFHSDSKEDELSKCISENNLTQIMELFGWKRKDLSFFRRSNHNVLFDCLYREYFDIADYFLDNVFAIDTVPLILKELIEMEADLVDFYTQTHQGLISAKGTEYILKKDFPVNQLSYCIQDGKMIYRTALDHARLCFHEVAVNLLLEYKAKSALEILGSQFVNPIDYHYSIPRDIRGAISENNLALLQQFIEDYPQLNWNQFFLSPMAWACVHNAEASAKFLLDYVDLALDKTLLLEILESEYEVWANDLFPLDSNESKQEQGPEIKWLEFALQHGANANHIFSLENPSTYRHHEGNLACFEMTTVLDRALELGLSKIVALFRQHGAKTLSELLGHE